MSKIRIKDREVGSGEPTFVIAEIGVNHDGSFSRAMELVDLAKQAGADCVKLQIFQAHRLMHGSASFAEYQAENVNDASPIDMLRRYELSFTAIEQIVRAIEFAGMIPLATPFSLEDVEIIEQLKLGAIKIASPDLVNYPLLQRCVESGRPLIISTGAASMDEVRTACGWLRGWKANFMLLHCVSSYPVPADDANLCWIEELARETKVPVGYSDHTTETIAGSLAVMAGACVVEKHLTYDKSASGPDHSASADGRELADYVQMIRAAEKLKGTAPKRVLPIERDVRSVSRQSLVLNTTLQQGEMLCAHHLTVQRPGTGIPAAMLPHAVGRCLRQPTEAGTLLEWSMLSDAA